MKHALTRAIGRLGLTTVDVAARLGVDPKTVERWRAGRVPYPRYRDALAELTGWSVRELWPESTRSGQAESALGEIRVAYAHRSAVPSEAWQRLFAGAQRDIGLLAYSALFLAEDVAILGALAGRARAGVRVRIVLGDPDGLHIARRGSDEGIGDGMTARIRNALVLYRPLIGLPGMELRLHDTVLYNSIYRADDDLFVNAHAFGCPASHAPVFHMRSTSAGGMADTYRESFERVWSAARPA